MWGVGAWCIYTYFFNQVKGNKMFSFFFVLVGFAMGYWFRKKQRSISDWFKSDQREATSVDSKSTSKEDKS